MTNTLNVIQNNLVIDVVDATPTLNVINNTVTLDVASGGIVAANVDLTLEAGENISALRAITTDANGKAVYANNDTAANALVIGISRTAALLGNEVNIQTAGTLTDASFNWNKGAIFLGTNGQLTQTAPTGGAYIVPIAKAITTDTVIIDVDNSLLTV